MSNIQTSRADVETLKFEERILLVAQAYAALPGEVTEIKSLIASIILKLK